VEALISRYGLLAVFVGTALEGDVALIVGGIAAHLGYLDALAVGVAGALGGFAGDAVWYLVARRNADWLRRSAAYRRVGPTIERLVTRFGSWQILLARPVYGTRVATMLFWGTQRLAPAGFAALDLPAATAWAILLVALGYYSSGSVAAVLGEVRRVETWAALALVLALSVAVVAHVIVRRAARRGAAP
jgi:membrane protein DedA with SNARE-associated domain